jgi:hypothetical protein
MMLAIPAAKKLSNGEPNIRRYEVKRNPLGPLQGAGEFFSDQLR